MSDIAHVTEKKGEDLGFWHGYIKAIEAHQKKPAHPPRMDKTSAFMLASRIECELGKKMKTQNPFLWDLNTVEVSGSKLYVGTVDGDIHVL
eukprot:Trichotokara_eunicae@DN8239_c0_g1_i1.p1